MIIKQINKFLNEKLHFSPKQKASTNEEIRQQGEQKPDVPVKQDTNEAKQVIKHEIPILKPIGIIGALLVLLQTAFNNPEKIESWIKIIKSFIPEDVRYSCEIYKEVKKDGKSKVIDLITVEFDISKNLEKLIGCDPVLGGIDATIPLNGNREKPDDPKLILMVDRYDEDLSFGEFYSIRQKEVEEWSNNKITTKDKREFIFQNKKAYELFYSNGQIKRKEIGFLYKSKAYTIRYEASVIDFKQYEKEATKIVDSLKFIDKHK
ncbi:hypothetical protein MAESPC_01201 [Microcystis aeruginosa SPC777]|uniref:Uncharacterized protein n=2 Tax=Microcystis aeruginosa TaxID=1126 RepID=S3JGM7_MICAE|nr:hypothetical protein MAESPC_01201 [Microcystis aeruginosa SPC777]